MAETTKRQRRSCRSFCPSVVLQNLVETRVLQNLVETRRCAFSTSTDCRIDTKKHVSYRHKKNTCRPRKNFLVRASDFRSQNRPSKNFLVCASDFRWKKFLTIFPLRGKLLGNLEFEGQLQGDAESFVCWTGDLAPYYIAKHHVSPTKSFVLGVMALYRAVKKGAAGSR